MTDIRAVCEEYSLEFVTNGPNVSRSAIGIACPFCGDDPSQHMNVTVEEGEKEGWWYCFRCQQGGRTPHRLFMASLGWSFAKACDVFGHPSSRPLPGDVSEFEQIARHLDQQEQPHSTTKQSRGLRLPLEFRKLWEESVLCLLYTSPSPRDS